MTEDLVTTAWTKIAETVGVPLHGVGRVGCIPVYDEAWWVFKNTLTVFEGAENVADPVKVDQLRRNVANLLEHYPATVPQLEKLGVRVKSLINRQIRTYEDVLAWALSIFNTGPIPDRPLHVHDMIDLAYDDVVIEVKSGRYPVYVIPADHRGSGNGATLDFREPGTKRKKRYGARHEYSKKAFAKQYAAIAKAKKEAEEAAKVHRPRGRPRADGLDPGSPEAREADLRKKEEQKLERARLAAERKAERVAAKEEEQATALATITQLRPPDPPDPPSGIRLRRPAKSQSG